MRRWASYVVSAAAVLVLAAACGETPPTPRETVPPASPNEPGPGDPPVVWLSGTLEDVQEGRLALREGGRGPRVELQRLAQGATAFYLLRDGSWEELAPEEVELLEVGQRVCVEALLDESAFLALRVFLGAGCGPSEGI